MAGRRLGRDDEGHLTPLAELVRGIAGMASILIFVVSVAGFAGYHYFDGRIHRVSLSFHGKRPAGAPQGSTNYLLVGTDSRAGTGGEYGNVGGQRSDTTILAHLDSDGTTTLVSFPRDTLVDIPGHGKDKINAAIQIGGPALLRATVENLTDIKIDHYVSVDLAGFKAITNAIGGVTVCVLPLTPQQRAQGFDNLSDSSSGWRGHAGSNRISGDLALAFVRQRYGLPNYDLDRIKRQQQFIGAVFRKASSGGVLANPAKLEGLLATATSALTVDTHTGIGDLRKLATRMRGVDPSKIRFETIPTRAATRGDGAVDDLSDVMLHGLKQSVLIYDPTALKALLAPLKGQSSGGSAASATPSPTATRRPAPADPASVPVAVFNGTSSPGLAARAAAALRALGYQVVGTGNASGGGPVTTHVVSDPSRLTQAQTVAAAVGGAGLEERAGIGSVVQLVLGADFKGVTATSTSGGAAGSPAGGAGAATPTPTATPPPVTTASLAGSCTY